MKRISEATYRSYGGGTGRRFYEDDVFEVTHWFLQKGKCATELQLLYGKRIYFQGHVALGDAKACFAQLTVADLQWMLGMQYRSGVEAGAEKAREEIRKALGVRR